MRKYIRKRLVGIIVLLLLASIAAFALVRLMSEDAAFAYLNSINTLATDAALVKIRAELGLDRPVIFQYAVWLRRMVCLDLGVLSATKKPMSGQLLISFRYTMTLTAMSAVWIVVLSLPLGTMTGKRLDSAGDQLIRGITFLGSSVPSFWLGFLLVELSALKLGLPPVQGAETFSHLVLSSATLTCSYITMYTKMIRDGVVENMDRRHAVYSRAKGLKKNTILWRHVFPNVLNPVFITLGLSFGSMLSGVVIVENVFTWPGMGRPIVSAVAGRDCPVTQGYILVIAVAYTLLSLGMDILCAAMNPQIRFEGEERWGGSIFRKLIKDGICLFYLFMLILSAIAAVSTPCLPPNDPNEIHYIARFAGISSTFLLGTDHMGRCTLSRTLYGSRLSLGYAVLTTVIPSAIGTTLGMLSGYTGGLPDRIFMEMCDAVWASPGIVIILAVVSLLGTGLSELCLGILAARWVWYARVARNLTKAEREKEAVLASRVVGSSLSSIITTLIFPAIRMRMLSVTTINFGIALTALVGYSLLGFGTAPPSPEWGMMIQNGRSFTSTGLSTMFWPSPCILAMVIFTDGLGDRIQEIAGKMRG